MCLLADTPLEAFKGTWDGGREGGDKKDKYFIGVVIFVFMGFNAADVAEASRINEINEILHLNFLQLLIQTMKFWKPQSLGGSFDFNQYNLT